MWETCGSARRVARVSARPRGQLQFITDRANNGNEARTMESIYFLPFTYGMTARSSYHSCDMKAGARSLLPVNGTGPGTCNQALGTFLSRCPKHSIARHPSFPTISPSADTLLCPTHCLHLNSLLLLCSSHSSTQAFSQTHHVGPHLQLQHHHDLRRLLRCS